MNLRSVVPAVVLCILSLAATAAADQIIPGDRVVNSINVRSGPSTATAIVGQLPKGATATLIEAVPHWYKIRLPDVSPAWIRCDR